MVITRLGRLQVKMKGFEIFINGRKINAALKIGLVITVVDTIEKTGKLSISGIDNESFKSVKWFQSTLSLGDKIKFVNSDIEKISVPEKIEQIDRTKLLAEYLELKKALIEEELLK